MILSLSYLCRGSRCLLTRHYYESVSVPPPPHPWFNISERKSPITCNRSFTATYIRYVIVARCAVDPWSAMWEDQANFGLPWRCFRLGWPEAEHSFDGTGDAYTTAHIGTETCSDEASALCCFFPILSVWRHRRTKKEKEFHKTKRKRRRSTRTTGIELSLSACNVHRLQSSESA